ncbi:MAG: Xaa-Pro peptidase family protein [Candidatus Nezhaarchaeales archaeon]
MKSIDVPSHVIKLRVKSIKKAMAEVGARGLLISQPENVQYVTGFNVVGNPPKNSWALILEDEEEAYLLVPALEYYEAIEEVKHAEVVMLDRSKKLMEAIADFLLEMKVHDPIYMDDLKDHDLISSIKRKLGVKDVRSMHESIEKLRAKKDEYEILCIKEAISRVKKGLDKAQDVLREGITEVSLVAEIEKVLWEEGIDGIAFDPIVASGPRSSFPHAKPTTRHIKRGDSVVIDLGVRIQGYCSDITRTFIVERNPEVEEVLDYIINVQEIIASHIKSGVRTSEINAEAVSLLRERKLDEYYLHGLGHGIGLSVHEKPTISSLSEDVLEVGNVVTLEPAVYFRGRFGVRHEDVFLVSDGGCLRLS